MRILGIDTATQYGVIGLLDEGKPRGEIRFSIRPGGGEKLPRVLQDHLHDSGWTPETIDLIAVGTGPGSYTGMRVGLAMARSLAFGLKRPLVSVPTHEVIAENGAYWDGKVAVLADARRNEVYTTVMSFQPEKKVLVGPEVLPIDELCRLLQNDDRRVLMLGDGARVYQEQLKNALSIPAFWGNPEDDGPSGLRLARLGWERWSADGRDETRTCEPLYLRRVEAEVRLDERRKSTL